MNNSKIEMIKLILDTDTEDIERVIAELAMYPYNDEAIDPDNVIDYIREEHNA